MKPAGRLLRSTSRLGLVLLVLLGASCHSKDISGPRNNGTPLTSGSVVVDRSAALLRVGQSQQLSARALNDAGALVNAAVVWTSSAPDKISVDAAGRVVARAIGSAMIFAESGTFRSAPVFVIVAEPRPGALLVSDAQVLSVGPPIGLASGNAPGPGTRYDVRLTGITTPPSLGTVVLAAGSAPVSGKVISTRSESGALVATLEMAPLSELLAQYDINWNIDLNTFPAVVVSAKLSAPRTLSTRAERFTPQPTRAAGDIIEPFKALNCDASLNGAVADVKVQLAPTVDLKLDFEDSPGHSKRVLVGSEKIVGTASIKLNAGFKVEGKCLAQALIRIPIGGVLAVGIMPGVRFGVGVSVEGLLAVTAGELSVTGELGVSHSLGWECGGTTSDCRSIEETTPINKFTPKVEAFNPTTGMRIELSGQFYAMVGLDAVFATQFTAGIIEARIGPVQSAELGFEDDQALNPTYASKYDLKLEAVVEPGPGLSEVLKLVFGGTLTFKTKFSTDISESPKGALNVSKSVVGLGGAGQTVDFTVNLSNTDYFLIGYNVVRVELWHKRATESNFSVMRTFNITASNQSVFTYTWQPTTDDVGPNEFAAFVYTQLPVPGLEIAENSIRKVDVKCFTPGPLVNVAVNAGPATCADTWVGTAFFQQPGVLQIDASVTWQIDPDTPEIDGDISYIATGTATFKWIFYEAMGCSVSQSVFPLKIAGSPSSLLVEFGESPPTYAGSAVTGGVVTITCPGEDPFQVPQFFLWFIGAGTVSANGTVIDGQNMAGDAVFRWHFQRP